MIRAPTKDCNLIIVVFAGFFLPQAERKSDDDSTILPDVQARIAIHRRVSPTRADRRSSCPPDWSLRDFHGGDRPVS